jgi:hypothetical protein
VQAHQALAFHERDRGDARRETDGQGCPPVNPCSSSSLEEPVLPIAVRLGACEVVATAFEHVIRHSEPNDQLALLVSIKSSLDSADPRVESASGAIRDLVASGALTRFGPQVLAYAQRSNEDRERVWAALKASAGAELDGVSALLGLVDISPKPVERTALIKDVFTAAAASKAEHRIPAAALLAVAYTDQSGRLRAVDLMTHDPWITRASLLGSIERFAPLLSTLGPGLAKSLMADVRETAQWWP